MINCSEKTAHGFKNFSVLLWSVLLFIILYTPASARTMVIPFKVTPADDAAHQWLGRAMSYYIAHGLELNGMEPVSDVMTTAILEINHIRFPYNVTKASILDVARRNGSDRVIWGDVSAQDGDKGEIRIRAFVIDLKNVSQKYLPLLKGKSEDLYGLQEVLLKHIGETMEPGKTIRLPAFQFNHRAFELLVKSFLVTDNAKRIELVKKAVISTGGKPPLRLQLEMAKIYTLNNQMTEAAAVLDRIEETSVPGMLDMEYKFLKALLEMNRGNRDGAIRLLETLTGVPGCRFEANYDLGVLYAGKEEWSRAESYFRQSLKERNDPEAWLNLVHVLVAGEEIPEASYHVVEALKRFPAREDLRQWFSLIMSQSEDGELLVSVFEDYIQDFFVAEKTPDSALKPKSPFLVHLEFPMNVQSPANIGKDADGSTKNNDIATSIEQLQDLLAINPFISDYYRQLSQLFLENKEFYRAERHAMAAVFLEKKKENLIQLAKIYRLLGKNKKADALIQRPVY